MQSGLCYSLCLTMLSILCAASGAVAAEDPGYRVAGVVTASEGNLAIIERPAGESVLVGPGDEVDDGQVLSIDETAVRIRFPDEELLLPLSGEAGERLPLSQATAVSAKSNIQPQKDTDVYTSYGRIDMSGISYAKSSTSSKSGSGSKPSSNNTSSAARRTDNAAASGGDPKSAENNAPAELARRLGPHTGLPEGLNVIDVNGQPVTAAGDSQKQIEAMLAEGTIVRLRVDGEDAGGVIYIHPE